jgi:AAA+ ATPase superfamily predicted ATPase
LKEFKDTQTFKNNIENTFFNKASILYEEAEILLREKLREVNTYFNIMKAIDNGGATELSEKNKDILSGECKWKDKVIAENVLSRLKEKSRHLTWHNQDRKEHFAIFAQSFSKKSKDCLCFEPKGLGKSVAIDQTKS